MKNFRKNYSVCILYLCFSALLYFILGTPIQLKYTTPKRNKIIMKLPNAQISFFFSLAELKLCLLAFSLSIVLPKQASTLPLKYPKHPPAGNVSRPQDAWASLKEQSESPKN